MSDWNEKKKLQRECLTYELSGFYIRGRWNFENLQSRKTSREGNIKHNQSDVKNIFLGFVFLLRSADGYQSCCVSRVKWLALTVFECVAPRVFGFYAAGFSVSHRELFYLYRFARVSMRSCCDLFFIRLLHVAGNEFVLFVYMCVIPSRP